jgi:hypothetical protein
MHIHSVIDMPERVAFVVANSNLAVSFGGHSPLSLRMKNGDERILQDA